MSVDGETVTIDRTAPDLVRTIIADGQTITIDTTREGVRTLTVDGTEITIDRSEEAKLNSFLQQFTGASAAYSLRDLASNSGNTTVARVRRSSDNAEADFKAKEVSDGALVTWVGAGNDGFVETWYDQSGNGNDAVQQVSGSQPKIVDGGVLVSGGLDFDGVDDGLAVSGQVLTSSSLYAASVMQHATGVSTSSGQNVFGQYQIGVSGRFQLSANSSSEYSFFASATNSISGFNAGALGTSQTLICINGDGSDAEICRDGDVVSTDSYSGFTPATVNFTIGIDASGAREFNGKIQELIIYNSDQSANRAAIETNINNQYDIY
jgi:hypothetical protein